MIECLKVELLDVMGNDLTVVNAARVSHNKKKDKFDEADARLLEYLITHKHHSPFAHPQLSFRVTAPLFVARQLWKHTVGAAGGDAGQPGWNEVSRRYVDDPPVLYDPGKYWRKRAPNVKQGSLDETVDLSKVVFSASQNQEMSLDELLSCLRVDALDAYGKLLEIGVAPEQARMVLPQSMVTQWIWTGSLLFWLRVVDLRLGAGAQSETGQIAQGISDVLDERFPHTTLTHSKLRGEGVIF